MSEFKILSIDGGGIRGIIPCVFLMKLEQIIKKRRNESILDYFDMIAGTSTGSIIAAGLASGLGPKSLLDLYMKNGQKIFPYQSRWSLKRINLLMNYGLSAPKYDSKNLQKLLKKKLGSNTLNDINQIKLLIPFYDTDKRTTEFFKSYSDETHESPKFKDIPLWEATLCSSSAPTFFPAHQLKVNGREYSAVDGGVAANNPVVCCIADALSFTENNDPKKIKIVSLGAGTVTRTIKYNEAKEWGVAEWAIPIIDVLMDGALDVYAYAARKIVGEKNILRLQMPLEKPLNDDMDDVSVENMNGLKSAADHYIETKLNRINEFF